MFFQTHQYIGKGYCYTYSSIRILCRNCIKRGHLIRTAIYLLCISCWMIENWHFKSFLFRLTVWYLSVETLLCVNNLVGNLGLLCTTPYFFHLNKWSLQILVSYRMCDSPDRWRVWLVINKKVLGISGLKKWNIS